jgi:hypothetical protein
VFQIKLRKEMKEIFLLGLSPRILILKQDLSYSSEKSSTQVFDRLAGLGHIGDGKVKLFFNRR